MRKLFLIIPILYSFSTVSQNNIDIVLDAYKKDKDLQHASYSFCVMEAANGKVLKEYNSELGLVPASTLKIVTTSAALGILGKDYTYKTNFYLASDSSSDKTTSHLLIKGSGDPSFNSSYFFDNDSLFLSAIANKIKTSKNFKSINGSIYIDNTYFNNTIPATWIWSDIGNYFGAGATSLSYKDNKFSLLYNSGTAGTEATLQVIQPNYFSKKITIESKVKAYGTEDNAFVFGDPATYTRLVSGTIPSNKKNYEVEAQMPQPELYFADELNSILKKINGINANSKPIVMNQKNSLVKGDLLYSYQSPKLEKIVYYTNTKSDNHYAESLLNTLGTTKTKQQGTTENGIDAVTNYWKERGVDVSGLHMVDGSGLSRANTVTTKIQTTILSKIYRDSTMYSAFNASLPVAGKNGSMTSLCKGTFAENNLRAKTGYINRARGYCGYVKTKSGKELAFSVLFNNYDCSAKDMKLKIEKFLVALTEVQ